MLKLLDRSKKTVHTYTYLDRFSEVGDESILYIYIYIYI